MYTACQPTSSQATLTGPCKWAVHHLWLGLVRPTKAETISGPQHAFLMLGLGVSQVSNVNTFLWLPIYLLQESLSYVDVKCDYRWLLIMLPWFHLDKYLIGKHIDYMKIVAKLYLLDKLDAKFECEYLDLYMSRLSYLRLRYRILVKFDFSP
jgi:hypothetical protein